MKQRQAKLNKLLATGAQSSLGGGSGGNGGNGGSGGSGVVLVPRPPRDGARKFKFRFPAPPRVSMADSVAAVEGMTHGLGPRGLKEKEKKSKKKR